VSVNILPQWSTETRSHLIVAFCGARSSNVLKRENRPCTTKRVCSGKTEALRELVFEKGIITEEEVLTRFERLSIEMKQKRRR